MSVGPRAERVPWAAALDRATLRLLRVGGRVLGRPSERLLARLAARDRPPPAPVVADISTAEAQITAGRLAFEAGDYPEALHRFGEAVRLAPEAPWAWHGRGDALQRMGRPADALEAYRRAQALNPDQGLHVGGEANALGALGRAEEAEAAWARALALDPGLVWMRRPAGARPG